METSRRDVYRHQDLVRIVEPRSIAIVGASPNPTSFGAITRANLRDFRGAIYLVNAKYETIGDERCYPSVTALPEVPDCVVVTVGRDSVEQIARECADRGVGGIVIYAAGYAETGKPEGAALQRRLASVARDSGLRIVGPNVVGLVNHVIKSPLTFTPEFVLSEQGLPAIGVISQSGGIANGLTQGVHLGITYSHMLSAGNSVDVDCADYLAYLAEDANCRAIAMVFEGLSSTERLMQAGELIARSGKPVLVCKFGRGEAGAAAAMSHTGFLAGSDAAYAAAFRRMGAIQIDNFHALIETAAFFAKAPAPKGRGIMALTVSGGGGVYVADVAESAGIELHQPSARLKNGLMQHMPDFGSPKNPCDITAAAPVNDRLVACAAVVFADDDYATVVIPHPYLNDDYRSRITNLSDIASRHGKMLAHVLVTEWMDAPGVREAHRHPNGALFRDTATCLRALSAWINRAERPVGARVMKRLSDPMAATRAATLIENAGGATLSESESKQVLSAYGVPVVEERMVQSVDEAVRVAEAIGMPVVLKVESPDLPHKTEAGVVRLNLRSAAEVKDAYEAVMANARRVTPPPRINGVLIQPMIPRGVEVIVGARIDPQFGPLVVVGLGGVLVELLKDTAVELAPVTPGEAKDMLARLKGRRMLAGFRGSEPVDEAALADVIVRISEFAADQRERIVELDVNPLICAGSKLVAVDALIVGKRGVTG